MRNWKWFVCMTVLSCLLLPGVGKVEAQGCFPGNIPTLAATNVQYLNPSQVPYAAVDLSVAQNDGNHASHNMTVGAGTGNQQEDVNINWNSYNTASLEIKYAWDNTTPAHWYTPTASSGTTAVALVPANAGHTLHFWLVGTEKQGSGSSTPTTQDEVSITVTNQNPQLYLWDSISPHAYAAVTTTYSGTPQISFADCPQMRTAHHTPTANLQLQSTSGGIRNTASSTGQAVLAGNSVFATVTDYISVGPNDSITGSFGGWTFCDVDGANIWDSLISFRIEYAKVVVKDLGHAPRPGNEKPVPSVLYDVAVLCDNNSDPPDWQPTVVHSWSSRHQYWWGATSLFRAPDLSGVPWIPVASYLSDIAGFISYEGGPWALAALVAIGGAVPYPGGTAPAFPIPGVCTQYPKNVMFTLGSSNIPWWPWSN